MEAISLSIIKDFGLPGAFVVLLLGFYRKQIWEGLTGSGANLGMEHLLGKNLTYFAEVSSELKAANSTLAAQKDILDRIANTQNSVLVEMAKQTGFMQGAKK